MIVIYTLSCPLTGEVRYVGKTNNPKIRFKNHCEERWRKNRKSNWIKSLRSRSLKPVMEIIEECPEDSWEDSERFWISYLNFLGCNLTNSNSGGDGATLISEETRRRLSEAHAGKRQTAETIEKRVKKIRGTIQNAQWVAKRSMSMRGKKRSKESRRKQSQSRMGLLPSQEHRDKLSHAMKRYMKNPEVRLRLSRLIKGRKKTPEQIARWVSAVTGRKNSPRSIQRMKAAQAKFHSMRPWGKSTKDDVIKIHKLKQKGMSNLYIAKTMGLTPATIRRRLLLEI